MFKNVLFSKKALSELPKNEIERMRCFYRSRTRRREKLIFDIVKNLNLNILKTNRRFDKQVETCHKICDIELGLSRLRIRDLVNFLKFVKDLGLSTVLLYKNTDEEQRYRYHCDIYYNFYAIKDNICYRFIVRIEHLNSDAPLYTFDKQ